MIATYIYRAKLHVNQCKKNLEYLMYTLQYHTYLCSYDFTGMRNPIRIKSAEDFELKYYFKPSYYYADPRPQLNISMMENVIKFIKILSSSNSCFQCYL